MAKKIYLASPYIYKGKDRAYMSAQMIDQIQNYRFGVASIAAAVLMNMGHVVFSPLSHSVPIAQLSNRVPNDSFEFWMEQDLPWVEASDELWVLQLPGVEDSKGVAREIEYATELGKPVKELTLEEVFDVFDKNDAKDSQRLEVVKSKRTKS